MSRPRIMRRLKNCRETISTSYRITFSTLLNGVIIVTRSWVLSLIKHRDSLELLSADPEWTSSFCTLIKVRRLVILFRGWTKNYGIDIALLAEPNEGGPVTEHGGFIINGITEYHDVYFCLDSLGERGAFPKLKLALAVELFSIDFDTWTLFDWVAIFLLLKRILFYIKAANICILSFNFSISKSGYFTMPKCDVPFVISLRKLGWLMKKGL